MNSHFQELVDAIFQMWGTPVTLIDSHDQLIAYSQHPVELTDEPRRSSLLDQHTTADIKDYVNNQARAANTVMRIPALPAKGIRERLAIPLRSGKTVTGYLYVIDPERKVDEAALHRLWPSLESFGREIELERYARFRGSNVVRGLISPDCEERALAERASFDIAQPSGSHPLRMACIGTSGGSTHLSDVFIAQMFGAGTPWTALPDCVAVLMPNGADAESVEFNDRLEKLTQHLDCRVAIGGEVSGLSEAHCSFDDARRTLTFLDSAATHQHVAWWDRLGSWRLLLMLDREAALHARDPRIAAVVDRLDAGERALLLGFLEGRKVDALAADHHIHRTTLYARMRRMAEGSSLDWNDDKDRLATILALHTVLLHP